MFYPQEMTEIELIVPTKDLLSVTKVLSRRGVFYQADSYYSSPEAKTTSPNVWQERTAAYAALERRILNIMQSLGVDEGDPPSHEFETMVEIETIRPAVDEIEHEVKNISDRLAAENKKIEQMQNLLTQLEPLAGIELEINAIRNPHYLYSVLGTMPVSNIDRLQTSLSRIPFVFTPLRTDHSTAVVWLAGLKSHDEILERAARSAYLNPINLPESYEGTPAEIIRRLNQNIEDARRSIEALKVDMSQLRTRHDKKLQSMLWEVRSSRMVTDAIVRYGRLKYTYLVVGWVVSSALADLEQRIREASKETIIETHPVHRGGQNRNVPIALRHSKLLRPFQMLVTTYGRPSYGELDPTILMAVMFPLLYGAMFGDVGQGLVLALLGWLIATKRILGGMASLGGVIMACGLSATIFGFLYGSIFGFEHVIPALWIIPVENILTILGIAIGAGVILLSLGFILGIINAWKARDWGRLLFDHYGIAGLVFYWSLIGLVASVVLRDQMPVPQPVIVALAAISGLAVMFSEFFIRLVEGHRPVIEGSLGVYIIQAFFELFETFISFLSNSLSYVRVGAFAVAHGGLSSAIFLLAELASPDRGVGYWIVILIGNIFIIGFEGLIVGIQTMRLSYYEFFGKFFRGGGMRYEPLTIRPTAEE